MSGREHEPIAAFFPSIDRNLMRDLDRHLRAAPQAAAPEPDVAPQDLAREPESPDMTYGHEIAYPRDVAPSHESMSASTSDILEAVDQAAATMAAMQARIQELEAKHYELETTNHQLRAKLGELLQGHQAAEASARADRERAMQAEQIAVQHQSRSQALEQDLALALNDLQRIAEAVAGALGNVGRS